MNDISRPEHGAPIPAETVRCVPPPEWVKHHAYTVACSVPNDAYVDNGLCRILYESQVNLDGLGFAYSIRSVQRVVTRAGNAWKPVDKRGAWDSDYPPVRLPPSLLR